MPVSAHSHLVRDIRNSSITLTGNEGDHSPLLNLIGDARFVLMGEATHGTEEFYRIRAELTKQLIRYGGFDAVAIEGDWPDSYRVNRYVQGDSALHNAHSALIEFERFPAWMWRNEVVSEFIDWLRNHNDKTSSPGTKTGFYGLDIYSLNASIKAVLSYLEKVDPSAAARARSYYRCFDHYYAENPQQYGYDSSCGLTPSCEQEVIRQLIALRQNTFNYMKRDGFIAEDEFFCAEQNAKAVVNAEKYYRTMFQGRASSWNLRDQHMADTLDALTAHLSNQRNRPTKIVVWAHNSHVGDARATEMGEKGEWNIGQLVRERHGDETVSIGFSTYQGTVTAASKWDGPAECKTIRPAMTESYEALFHETGLENFLLILRGNHALQRLLHPNRLQRAIGVLYLPETERQSHYCYARLAEQFDAVIHINNTTALKPLEVNALWHKGEVFDTYPAGL